jgi:hypothetical protein
MPTRRFPPKCSRSASTSSTDVPQAAPGRFSFGANMTPVQRAILLLGRRSAAPAFTPLDASPLIWYDPSNAASGFQESTASTPAVLDSPIGYRGDLSGNARHAKQATSAARPTWKLDSGIYSDLFDGVDDGIATATFSAGTLPADCDAYIAVKRTAGNFVMLQGNDGVGDTFIGAAIAGSGSGINDRVGAPTSYVDNALVTTRGQVATAVADGAWHIFEARNLNLSAWIQFKVSLYPALQLNGNIGGVIITPASSAAVRTQLRTWLANKVGVTL